ncbi:hypothetical protein [Leptolyngbya sp. 7M]|uniref:hypothetical protein n=1 Tax=Leptolyngbya sp. 7M TaxID=2812896 RepID=UPI001B8C1458|nr:hypothetical protein [Leptolyngbya sp. 7M]QYO67842.1 hypothetical protein JVX88_14280 [Leptolyngbya sp. 7M]
MNNYLKGTILLFLGIVMLGWFVYSIINPPQMPSETYTLDWVMIFVRLIVGITGMIGGILAFVKK